VIARRSRIATRVTLVSRAAVLALAVVAGCSIAGMNTLGGRERCWDPTEQRLPSLMKGTLQLAPNSWRLATPEGDVLGLSFAGAQVMDVNGRREVVDASGRTVAADGELVTVFGGLGGDGSMVVCGVEERHAG